MLHGIVNILIWKEYSQILGFHSQPCTGRSQAHTLFLVQILLVLCLVVILGVVLYRASSCTQ